MLLQMALFHLRGQAVSAVHTNHVVLTQSPVSGPLGCLHVLATVKSAAVDTGVHVSVFVLDMYSGAEFLDHMVVLFLIF